MPGPKTKSPAENFAKHVVKGDECWSWRGSKHKFGYGWFRVNGKTMLAHRVAYELARGPLPQGSVILHTCDNPECTNPDHLARGTHADNVADKLSKGRHLRSDGLCTNVKIKQSQHAEILALRNSGMAWGEVAKELHVHRQTVRRHAARVLPFLA